MFFVTVENPGKIKGVYAACSTKEHAERQKSYLETAIQEGKGFILHSYPDEDESVAVGPLCASKYGWIIRIIEENP